MVKEGKREILFRKGIKVQGLNRVAIPKELLENLNLKEGDYVSIYYDTEKNTIILKGDKNE